MKTCLLSAVVLSALFLTAGCSQETLESAGKDAAKNAVVVKREVQRAERKARPQLNKLNLGARVTAALKANQKLPGTIRVDAGEKGVWLRGKVRTREEKELAERIARDTLSDDKIVTNELKVEEK